MNTEAFQENVRTLAQILGESEQKAAQLLDASIAILVDDDRKPEAALADFLVLLLQRTVSRAQINPGKNETFTLVVNIGKRSAKNVDLFVAINSRRIVIQREAIELELAESQASRIWPLVGACYAAAQIIKLLVGDALPVPETPKVELSSADLLGDVIPDGEKFDIGSTWLAGAGAIGNAFVFALSLMNPTGQLHIVDPDSVEGGNLNRCLCFTDDDLGFSKAERLALWAKSKFDLLKVVEHKTELAKVAERSDGPWLPRLVVAVDSRRVRRHLQNEIPGEVFDASTTDIREMVLHFNRQPLDGLACMSCIYFQNASENAHEEHVAEALGVTSDEVQSQFVSKEAAEKIATRNPQVNAAEIENLAYDSLFKQLCGEGKLLSSEDKQVFAPFAFVSVLAGVLLASEFRRRLMHPESPRFNYWRISPWSSAVIRARRDRRTFDNCEFCSNPILRKISNSMWANSTTVQPLTGTRPNSLLK